MIFRARDFRWDFSKGTLVMGVINATPDSFSDGGESASPQAAAEKARSFEAAGAALIDIGAESTRPGAQALDADEERARLIPVLEAVLKATSLPVSVDSTKAPVAEAALQAGASIVNDVSGLKRDPEMAKTIFKYSAGVVLMHSRGNSETMQSLANYRDLIAEIAQELNESIDIAFRAGISYDHIAIDPGIGFAKDAVQNLSVLKHLDAFTQWRRPLVLGTSRKSFIGSITGKGPKDRAFGTAATIAMGIDRGVSIVRVHDVAEMADVVKVADAIVKAP